MRRSDGYGPSRSDDLDHSLGDLDHSHLLPIRRALEGLVRRFEDRRVEQVAEQGATVVAAYDTGIKHAVREALEDLNAGRYGFCIACSERISFERLCEVPYARRCAGCQLREERSWNETEHLFAGFVRQWVGEPQGPTVKVQRHSGS